MHSTAGRSMDRVFAALADPTRRAIIAALAEKERGATELVRVARASGRRMSQPAVSRHLRVLREAGLIRKRVHGRNHWCVIRGEALGEAAAWLERYREFWEERLDALAEMFEAGGGSGEGEKAKRRRGEKSERSVGSRRK